ncbi:PTS transporter subunit EIIC [Alicyclobacillus shizuokensis]|uniref:PTS transporter subunit EIIC n=1 Tax=Alicyclobacillus shizuokensis TaxID=392014 RepID=UPI00082F7163|nr:PTS transporter subunit EIIC [Alicyclobacillus shizuokensis]MCL6626089.1 PTS transporter subunit EIIC [Alicyclobacillus shizuokensis]
MQARVTLVKVAILMGVVFLMAAILYWLGLPGAVDVPFLVSVGYGVLSNYAAILAVGIAVALANENQGAAGLAAFVAYEVIIQGASAINKSINLNDKSALLLVAGLISGALAGYMYNRFYRTKLPSWLGFFGGRRFVPIVTGFAALFIALVIGHTWQ